MIDVNHGTATNRACRRERPILCDWIFCFVYNRHGWWWLHFVGRTSTHSLLLLLLLLSPRERFRGIVWSSYVARSACNRFCGSITKLFVCMCLHSYNTKLNTSFANYSKNYKPRWTPYIVHGNNISPFFSRFNIWNWLLIFSLCFLIFAIYNFAFWKLSFYESWEIMGKFLPHTFNRRKNWGKYRSSSSLYIGLPSING